MVHKDGPAKKPLKKNRQKNRGKKPRAASCSCPRAATRRATLINVDQARCTGTTQRHSAVFVLDAHPPPYVSIDVSTIDVSGQLETQNRFLQYLRHTITCG